MLSSPFRRQKGRLLPAYVAAHFRLQGRKNDCALCQAFSADRRGLEWTFSLAENARLIVPFAALDREPYCNQNWIHFSSAGPTIRVRLLPTEEGRVVSTFSCGPFQMLRNKESRFPEPDSLARSFTIAEISESVELCVSIVETRLSAILLCVAIEILQSF